MFFFLVFFISSILRIEEADADSSDFSENDSNLNQDNDPNGDGDGDGDAPGGGSSSTDTEPTVEEPGNITDPGVQSIVQSESRDTFYTVVATTVPVMNGDTMSYSPTEIVSSWVEVYIYQINVTEIPTATAGMEYKVVVFKPGILIGVLGGLLFIIGLVYTICCRKKGLINLAELKKKQRQIAMQNKDSSSDSFDDIKPKKEKKTKSQAPKKSSNSKAKSRAPEKKDKTKNAKSKSKKGHRH